MSSLPAKEVKKESKGRKVNSEGRSFGFEACNGQAVGTVKEVSGHLPAPFHRVWREC